MKFSGRTTEPGSLGDAEVEDFDASPAVAPSGHEEVRRLDVAVNDPRAVCLVESLAGLHDVLDGGGNRQWPLVRESRGQVVSFEVYDHLIRRPGFEAPDVGH